MQEKMVPVFLLRLLPGTPAGAVHRVAGAGSLADSFVPDRRDLSMKGAYQRIGWYAPNGFF